MKTEEQERAQYARIERIPVLVGRQLAYGHHPDQFIELHGEFSTAERCLFLVHGGYFRARYDLAHMRPMAAALAARGVLVILIEYRRGPGSCSHALDDVATAFEFAWQRLGDWNVVPEQLARHMVVSGHSAGGCLVLAWASHQDERGPALAVRPLAPISDLVREANLGLFDHAVREFMGGMPADALRAYLDADPRSRATAIPARISVEIIHGVSDGVVDIGFSRDFPAARIEVEGAGHFDLVDPGSPAFPDVAKALLAMDFPQYPSFNTSGEG